jgi:hypothetical protein
MSNDRREAGGGPDDERRPQRDRERDGNPWSPSYDRIWSVLKQIGVDINQEQSIEQWNADMEWVRERRKREKRWQSARGQLFLIGAGSIVTGAVTWVISWLNLHFGSGGGHQ